MRSTPVRGAGYERSDAQQAADRGTIAGGPAAFGLTQGQAAKRMDMHRPTISEIEAGNRNVTMPELARFAEVYDVDLAWLSGVGPEKLDPRTHGSSSPSESCRRSSPKTWIALCERWRPCAARRRENDRAQSRLGRGGVGQDVEMREEAGLPFSTPVNVYDMCEEADAESTRAVRGVQHGRLV